MTGIQTKKAVSSVWVSKAFDDYAAARCLLLNWLPAGFILAQQAIEKMLKAYLRIKYPSESRFVGSKYKQPCTLPVNASHDLIAHAKLVLIEFPELHLEPLIKHEWLLKALSLLYEQKYPDSSAPHNSSTTAWLQDIDDLMISLSMQLPIEADTLWRTGVFACVWPLVLIDQPDPPWYQWVRQSNLAFNESFATIARIVAEGHKSCYADSLLVRDNFK
jgi:hypothetical protein